MILIRRAFAWLLCYVLLCIGGVTFGAANDIVIGPIPYTTGATLFAHVQTAAGTWVHIPLTENSGQGASTYSVIEDVANNTLAVASNGTIFPKGFPVIVSAHATSLAAPIWAGRLRWNGTGELDPLVDADGTGGGGGGGTAAPSLTLRVPPLAFVPRTGSKLVRATIIVRDDTGALVDPDSNTINLAYADPNSGTLPSLPATATRESAGRYKVDMTILSTSGGATTKDQRIVITATADVSSTPVIDVENTQLTITPPTSITVSP